MQFFFFFFGFDAQNFKPQFFVPSIKYQFFVLNFYDFLFGTKIMKISLIQTIKLATFNFAHHYHIR